MTRSAHWLTIGRVTFYARVILTIYVIAAVVTIGFSPLMESAIGKPLQNDFIVFWAASHLGLSGHAVDAYDLHKLTAAGREGMPAMGDGLAWYYLPTFYLVILPLAWLPWQGAWLAFMATTLPPYLLAIRRAAQPLSAGLFILAYPGLWMNLKTGQNGFLTAALAGWALLSLRQRPILAGVLVGLLAIKPHLAVLFPLALLADRAWKTFWTAAITVILFVALSVWLLGPATLEAALGSINDARQYLEGGLLLWGKIPSLFAWLQHLGVAIWLVYVAHVTLASVAALCVWTVWRHSQDDSLRGAVLMIASLMVSPFVYAYDLTWLALPIAWLAVKGLRNGWLPGEREILLGAWLTPLLMLPMAEHLNVQVAPLVLAALLWMVMRRAGGQSGSAMMRTRSNAVDLMRSGA